MFNVGGNLMNKISDDILCRVEKPIRYTGGELNSFSKDKNKVDIRVAFCFPEDRKSVV